MCKHKHNKENMKLQKKNKKKSVYILDILYQKLKLFRLYIQES